MPMGKCALDYCQPLFDDHLWRTVEVPHDWSIEELPPRSADPWAAVLSIRNGTWRFHQGDNASWAQPGINDHTWASVTVPGDWRNPPLNYKADNAVGWFRQQFTATPQQLAAADAGNLMFDVGTVSGADETYINGVHIG